MSICTFSEHGFRTLLHIATASLAFPSSFAVPVDAIDDQEFLTIVFNVGNKPGTFEVSADERSVTVRERTGAARICRLPCSVDGHCVRTTFAAPYLRVTLRKKSAAFDLPFCAGDREGASDSRIELTEY